MLLFEKYFRRIKRKYFLNHRDSLSSNEFSSGKTFIKVGNYFLSEEKEKGICQKGSKLEGCF